MATKFRARKKKKCTFCSNDITYIDYKDVKTIKRYVSDKGKILPKRVTGTCVKHQRMLSKAIKRARQMALIPYTKN